MGGYENNGDSQKKRRRRWRLRCDRFIGNCRVCGVVRLHLVADVARWSKYEVLRINQTSYEVAANSNARKLERVHVAVHSRRHLEWRMTRSLER